MKERRKSHGNQARASPRRPALHPLLLGSPGGAGRGVLVGVLVVGVTAGAGFVRGAYVRSYGRLPPLLFAPDLQDEPAVSARIGVVGHDQRAKGRALVGRS